MYKYVHYCLELEGKVTKFGRKIKIIHLNFFKGLIILIKNIGHEKHVMKGSLFRTFALIKNHKMKVWKREFFFKDL
jgi:hypothetical protein